MRGYLYCADFIGAGHLVRMLHLCRELVRDYEIVLFHKPIETGIVIDSDRFTSVALAEEPSARSRQLDEAAEFPCAFFLTEQFPFGKSHLRGELMPFIEKVRKKNPEVFIAASYRGSSYRGSNADAERRGDELQRSRFREEEREVLKVLESYDLVFVHTDPALISLEETFYFTEEIVGKVRYTGFIVPDAPLVRCHREKELLVIGNGKELGTLLIFSMVEQAKRFPDYHWRFVVGPYVHGELLARKLEKQLKEEGVANGSVERFIPNINDALSRCSLAITNGGMIVLNHYMTDTPALVLPDPALPDQCFLSEKFDGKAAIRVIQLEEFNPEAFSQLIKRQLAAVPDSSSPPVDLSGAKKTRLALNELVGK